jgi:anaerobic selenocysteine-containing dehydrogenase
MAPETAKQLGLVADEWVAVEAPTTDRAIKRRVSIVKGMHPRVVNAEGLWYMPGATDLVAGALETGANVLTPLRDDVDPVIGGSIARCLLCRIRKTNQPGEARAA